MANGNVNAVQIGSYFVGQYYQVLQKKPELVHQFYNDASAMVRIDGDSNVHASSMLQICTLIMSLNFTGIEIKSITSLDSWNGGILVMVSGFVKARDFNGQRKFCQSFILAPQQTGYFVLNDIFQFIDEEVIYQDQSPILSGNNFESQMNAYQSLPRPSVSDYVLEEEVREYSNSIHVEDVPVDKYSLSEQQQYQEPWAETVVVEAPPKETSSMQTQTNVVRHHLSAAPEERVAAPPVKKTWASILSAPKTNSVSSVATHPIQHKSVPSASEGHQMPQPHAQQSNSGVPSYQENVTDASAVSLAPEDEESRSVYVRNLSSNVSSADLEQEFSKFGEITPDGIFIRNREDLGICYAFVEFADVVAVQNALQASPLQVAGRQAYVEERRPSANSTSRGRGRGRGRGSYQTEAPRGHLGGRGGNDYSRQRASNGY